jgi:hypothetical protein
LCGGQFFDGDFLFERSAFIHPACNDTHRHRFEYAGIFRAFSGSVGGKPLLRILADAAIERAVFTQYQVNAPV